jgi:hypothetical protein
MAKNDASFQKAMHCCGAEENSGGLCMAEIDNAVMENVATFLERLKAAGMQIAGAWLFGSHLTGKADEWSDIDLAVISPQIRSDRFEERVPADQDCLCG